MTIRFLHHNHKTTFAVEVDDKDDVVAFATSHCSPEDQFVRKMGRIKAAGRLKSKNYRQTLGVSMSFKEFTKFVFDGEIK